LQKKSKKEKGLADESDVISAPVSSSDASVKDKEEKKQKKKPATVNSATDLSAAANPVKNIIPQGVEALKRKDKKNEKKNEKKKSGARPEVGNSTAATEKKKYEMKPEDEKVAQKEKKEKKKSLLKENASSSDPLLHPVSGKGHEQSDKEVSNGEVKEKKSKKDKKKVLNRLIEEEKESSKSAAADTEAQGAAAHQATATAEEGMSVKPTSIDSGRQEAPSSVSLCALVSKMYAAYVICCTVYGIIHAQRPGVLYCGEKQKTMQNMLKL
jgi:hypothetical protein